MIKRILHLIVILFLFSGCEDEINKKVFTIQEPKENADQISYNFSAYFVDSNFTKAELSAYRARIFSSKKETYLDSNVKVNFFSKKTGNKESNMRADTVVIDDVSKNMTAFGKVFVMSDLNKATLKAKMLIWNNSTQKLTSTSFVTYSSKYETISGWGFESDQNLENYKFTKVAGEQR